jgi:hypothetical protein
MWRHFAGLLQRADEHLPLVVVDALLAIAAATLITLIVRSIVV